jgi:drug/metabolite transporter (DMT)-like permease
VAAGVTATRVRPPTPDVPAGVGPGRVLLGLYAVFVVAAGARSTVQLATDASRAPLAYLLSLGAAVVYAAGFVAVRRVERGGGAVLSAACSLVELAGVLTVGTVSVVDASAFAQPTVWSYYGAGYLGVPLVLPVVVLVWLRRR